MDIFNAIQHINWLSILLATVSAFILGGIWYGPFFGKAWLKEFNISEEKLKSRSTAKTFGLSFILIFIASFNMEMFIGPDADITFGAMAGFFTGFGWVATFLGVLYLFEMHTLKAFLINSGYCVVSLTIIGMILGIM